MKTLILILFFSVASFSQNFLLLMDDGASWSPLDASIIPTAWYVGDVPISTITWADQSGNGNNLNCQQLEYKPTTGTLKGHTTLIFDGTNQHMRNEAGFVINQPISIYIVARQITWGANMTWWDGKTGDKMLLRERNSTPEIDIYSGLAWIEGNVDLAVNTFGVIRAVYNGASSSLRVDDNAATIGNAGANNSDGFVIGATWGVSYAANIEVAEIIIYSGSLSVEDDTNITNYLKNKYGL